MNIVLKCTCGAELTVGSAAGMEDKNLACPQCKRSAPVKEYYPKFSLHVGDRNYQLRFGNQWVGRKTDSNDAEVQIPDESRYMSKKHALINLSCTPNGIECTFEEHGKNPSEKDGIKLIKDDIIYLRTNDCLKLGETKMYLANEFGEKN